MSSSPLAVDVRGLSKVYQIKHNARRATSMVEALSRGLRFRRQTTEQFWALKDATFEVHQGEVVGIIGHNGAGKSTLLKIITGTTRPSTGSVRVSGRIAALLELGMGFHPHFTGRQNAYMAGQLLGYSAPEIATRMREIEAFAEIGDYIDQPVRTYSSGMQVRLAFSVATCIRPDILIVDEALSVGDAYFQAKSFARIREFRTQGTTLLFVSHSASTIKTLCDRAILLDRGAILRDDAPDAVLDYYNAIIARREAENVIRVAESKSGATVTRSGSRQARLLGVELLDAAGRPARALRSSEAAEIVLDVAIDKDLPELTAGILVRDTLGNDVFGTNTFHHGKVITKPLSGARYRIRYRFDSLALGRGNYNITAALHAHDMHTASNYDWWDQALVFQVVPGTRPFSIGACDLPVSIEVETAG